MLQFLAKGRVFRRGQSLLHDGEHLGHVAGDHRGGVEPETREDAALEDAVSCVVVLMAVSIDADESCNLCYPVRFHTAISRKAARAQSGTGGSLREHSLFDIGHFSSSVR